MNKISIIALSALILIGAGTYAAEAYKGDPSKLGPNCTPAEHDAVSKAITVGDYDSWKSLMSGRGRASEVVTKENFSKFREAYMLRLDGKTVEANKIRAELGLGLKNGSGKSGGQRMGMHNNK